ncbi:hypothetical protein AVEN_193752-1 [Araneus ventricosus]|uniref:Retrovirus-related Pol polyprotein from transposon opus n=1 Tax=Araneus ventricosus TaxID=182803 RepID=A0A4Y2DKX7_ARAVE|nr:hypothetical protein AVEN_193752-1 [Araneus ventricosus]
MRRDELLKSDFRLDHLNDKDKKDMQELLLKNCKVFSKSYKTLGETTALTPEFSLLHNFPSQTKPYPIPLIAKKYAQQEINNLLEAGIIEPSSSSYCLPVIFIKKEQNPNDSNSEPKFRMVVDYRLLNSITETFKVCLPKISEIIKNIADASRIVKPCSNGVWLGQTSSRSRFVLVDRGLWNSNSRAVPTARDFANISVALE